jgi:uncharacterized protein YkwD
MAGTWRSRAARVSVWVAMIGSVATCAPVTPGPGLAGSHGPTRGAAAAMAGVDIDSIDVAAFLERLDLRRAQSGCPPLEWDARIAEVAMAHSRDMVERGYFSHTSPDGRSLVDRLWAAGVRFATATENIAHGRLTSGAVFDQWHASPVHLANMLDCRYTRHGVGRHGSHWTQVLIRPPT